MKKLFSLLLVLALTVALAACGSAPEPENAEEAKQTEAATTTAADKEEATTAAPAADAEPVVFNWNIGADPKTLDPTLNGASDGGDVINNTFEGLTRERSGVVYPGIAESWDVSEDGLTVTFNLRKSNWSDGTPLTAHDFVYGWKRGMNPATASEYAWIWHYTNIVGAEAAVDGGSLDEVGVTALDDYTLEVKLLAPTDYIVSLLSFYHFMPIKESVADVEGVWAKDPEKAVSNGAFKLVEYNIGEGLKLVKNEEYWNADAAKIDVINGKFIDEASTAYQAYQAGDLDFLPDVPTAEIPKLIAEDPNFYVFPLLGTYYYSFNLDLDMWSDVRVRRAMALAIDREQITETLASGQVPAGGFVPPGFTDADGNDFFETAGLYGFATDSSKVAEAQALLEEAGYPMGEGFPEFTILYNTSEGHKLVAEMVQEMLKTNLGLNASLANQEWAVFQDTRKEGDFEIARGGWLTDFMDPMGLLGIFKDGVVYNDPNYNNPAFDELMDKAAATTGKEHFDYLYQAQDVFMNDVPIIPVYHYSDVMLASDKLVGWDRSVLSSMDFTTAEIVE